MNTGGQTPGVPALLEKHLRDAEVSLWPANRRHSVTERVQRWFPKLLFVAGAEALKTALAGVSGTAFLREAEGAAEKPGAFSAPQREGSSNLELAPLL